MSKNQVVELEGTLAVNDIYARRRRICDLGYLQTPYIDAQGRLQGRCPAEPVDNYARKGGEVADTERRACLCNGLTTNIGLGQRQKWGRELPLLTAGDELMNLPLGSADRPSYTAAEVLEYLHGLASTAQRGPDGPSASSGERAGTPRRKQVV